MPPAVTSVAAHSSPRNRTAANLSSASSKQFLPRGGTSVGQQHAILECNSVVSEPLSHSPSPAVRISSAAVRLRLEARSAARDYDHEQNVADTLRRELEDHRVAALGYQVDLERERRNLQSADMMAGSCNQSPFERKDRLNAAIETLRSDVEAIAAQMPLHATSVAALRWELRTATSRKCANGSTNNCFADFANAQDSAHHTWDDLASELQTAQNQAVEECAKERCLRQERDQFEAHHALNQSEFHTMRRRIRARIDLGF